MTRESKSPPFSSIQLWADIDGIDEEVPIVSLDMTYALNDIPQATIKIAMGESAADGASANPIHAKAASLSRRTAIKIYATIEGEPCEGKTWNMSNTVVFDGYINRPSYTRGTGAAGLTYIVDHWLSDLAVGTKVTSMLAARGIADLYIRRKSVYETFDKVEGLNIYDSAADVWTGAVKPTLKYLATDFVPTTTAVDGNSKSDRVDLFGLATDESPDTVLAGTYGRMDNAEHIDVGTLTFDPENVGISGNNTEYTDLSTLLGMSITSVVADPGSGLTAWDTIASLARELYFSVVPAVNSATCAPVAPDSGDTVTIAAEEYTNCDMSAPPSTRELPIGAVILYGSTSGLESRPGNISAVEAADNVVGVYPPSKEKRTRIVGQVVTVPSPRFIARRRGGVLQSDGSRTSGVFSEPTQHKTLPVFTGHPSSLNPNVKTTDTPQVLTGSKLGDAFAQMIYVQNVFGSSNMSVRGRLRFDIAPGTPIRVEMVGSSVPYGSGADAPYMYGVVNRVTVSISAESTYAATTLDIGSVHTSSEHDTVLPDKHPLYSTRWGGTALIPNTEI